MTSELFDCPSCDREGHRQFTGKCPDCDGTGKLTKDRLKEVEIENEKHAETHRLLMGMVLSEESKAKIREIVNKIPVPEHVAELRSRLVSMEAVVEKMREALKKCRHLADESPVYDTRHDQIIELAEQALSLTPDQSLLESMRKEIEGLKASVEMYKSIAEKWYDHFKDSSNERASLRSQLADAQEKLKVAEDALTESRECLNGMVYSGPLQKSWMGRSRKSVQGSTVALQAIRLNNSQHSGSNTK